MIYRQRFSRLRFFSAIEMTAQYVPAGAALTIMANNLALRFAMSFETVTDEVAESIFNYKTDVPLFESGRDACEHGLKDYRSAIRKRIETSAVDHTQTNMNNHRFILRRNWIGSGGRLNFIPVNPSTADDRFDDNTVRKMVGFGKRWGFSRIDVTNAFAFRATDPGDLQRLAIADVDLAIGGAENDRWIIETARCADMIVVAWGGHGRIMGRDEDVLRLLAEFDLYCIGKTAHGDPLHPCRAAYTAAPLLFRKATVCASAR